MSRKSGHFRVNYVPEGKGHYRSKSYKFGDNLLSEYRAFVRAKAFADEQTNWYMDKFTHEIMRKGDEA